jgi:hypothetical protein
MICLDTTTRKLQIFLAGAVATSQLPVVVCYSDQTAVSYPGGTQVVSTNSTATVDICSAPAASTTRDIDTINVQNADTAAATVTIQYNDNATTYTLFKALLAVGDQLTYVHGQGWSVLDSTGAIKSGGSGGSISDGDKGDITVSASGATWTVDNDAITYAKMQNVSATDKLLGRSTAGAGDVEEIACTAAGRALLDDADATAQRVTLGLAIGTDVLPVASPSSSGTLTHSGDIVLSGSGKRITGDLSNATASSRLLFKNSLSASTTVGAVPGTTATQSGYIAYNAENPDNAQYVVLLQNSSEASIRTAYAGTPAAGTFLPLTFYTGGAKQVEIPVAGGVQITQPAGLGYGTGAGGTATQATSRTTSVPINKPTGDITLFTAAGSAIAASFTVTNSLVAATDVPTIAVRSATNKYITAVTNVATGSFEITFYTTGGVASDTPIFHFNLGKGATS